MPVLTGSQPVFTATGGYTFDQSYNPITLADQQEITSVDVTNALQIEISRSVLNAKLGDFSLSGNAFANDSITISSADLSGAITSSSQIVSVGKLSSAYEDFIQYVTAYFSMGGFETLFDNAYDFSANTEHIFDAAAVDKLVHAQAATGVSEVAPVAGSITISDINKRLRYALDFNTFGNRNANANPDAANGVEDGFVAGDYLWITAGITLKLHLAVGNEAEIANLVNNIGPTNAASTATSIDSAFTGAFSAVTTPTGLTLIERTVIAPLLIIITGGDAPSAPVA